MEFAAQGLVYPVSMFSFMACSVFAVQGVWILLFDGMEPAVNAFAVPPSAAFPTVARFPIDHFDEMWPRPLNPAYAWMRPHQANGSPTFLKTFLTPHAARNCFGIETARL